LSILTTKKTIVIGIVLATVVSGVLIGYGIRQPTPVVTQPIPFRTIIWAEGGREGPFQAENLVINDNDTWSRVYSVMCSPPCPNPLPAVNFTTSTILAVFAGPKPTAGYLVNVTEVAQGRSSIAVQILYRVPSPECLTAQVLTHPYHIVTIPKTELPVAFNVGPPHYICGLV
jgi:hypothetical protein